MKHTPFDKSPLDSVKEFFPLILKVTGAVVLVFVLIFGINFALNTFAPGSNVDGNKWIPSYSMVKGDKDSKVKVVFFFDLQCSACKANEPTLLNVVSKLQDKKVSFVYRNFPLSDIHPMAQLAAEGAQSASRQGLDKYLAYKAEVYALQSELSPTALSTAARNANLDYDQWNRDRNSNAVVNEVKADLEFVKNLNLPQSTFNGQTKPSGTPTTVVLVDDQPVNWWSGGLDEAAQLGEIEKRL